jgi:hypothetical protein
MGFVDACFDDSDETLCRHGLWRCGGALTHCWQRQGFATLSHAPMRTFCTKVASQRPSGRCEFFSATPGRAAAKDGLPDHLPNHELPGNTTHRFSVGHDFASSAQLSEFKLSSTSRACVTIEGRTRCWNCIPTRMLQRGALWTADTVLCVQ